MKAQSSSYQIFNKNCNSKFLLLCDHATNRIPSDISTTNLGLSKKDLNRHIAYDIGALKTAFELSKFLEAPLISSNFSRLVIDVNRSTEDPTSIMQIYDGAIIPGNCNLSEAEINCRHTKFYDPYHNIIAKFIKQRKILSLPTCLVSIHSFTPKLKFQRSRPWHIGILWDRDTRMSELVLKELAKYKTICIGRNKPYSGKLKGDTLSQHGTSNKLLHVLIEIRNDLITDTLGQKKWSKVLGTVLMKSIQQI